MVYVTLGILRIFSNQNDSMSEMEYHNLRKQLVNDLLKEYQLTVNKNNDGWKNLNDIERPHEYAEIIIALGTAGVFTSIVTAFKNWLDDKKIGEINIKKPDGSEIRLSGIKKEDIKELAKEFQFL